MPRKILICEELLSHGQQTRQTLLELLPNVEVYLPEQGSQLVEEAVRLNPDIILISCQSSDDSDGFSKCQQILNNEETAQTTVILVTSIFISPSDRLRAFQAGATGIISRPFNEQELRTLLSITLPMKMERSHWTPKILTLSDRIQSPFENGQNFRLIFDYSADPALLLDEFAQITEANPAACQLLGMLHKDLTGSPFATLVTSEDRGQVLESLDNLVEGRIESLDEIQFTSSESSMALEITSGVCAGPGVLIHLRDISHRKNVANALRESRIRAEAVLNTAVDGIITIDEKGMIETVNRSACNIFGYEEQELKGTSINNLMSS